jgi:S1-C subfamily serine protease
LAVLTDTWPVNLIDVGIVVLLVFGIIAGWRSGFFPQILGLAGAALGAIGVVLALPLAHDFLAGVDPALRAIGVLVGLLVAIGVGEAIGSNLGAAIGRRLGEGVLGDLDRIAGALAGLAQGFLVVWLVGGLLAAGPVPQMAAQAQRSWFIRTITARVPPPTAYVEELAGWLDATGLPEVFIGLEPFPAAPVEKPSDAQAERIARAAAASTVVVRATACGRVSTGTGFVVGRGGYLVTNAHVVAGSKAVIVAFDGAGPYDADVVLFDPKLDIAVLHAPQVKAEPLEFAAGDPPRGTLGAALGHPGGAPLRIIPAAVSNSYSAEGRDLYGTGRVTRRIVELRADIERGDSGGPLILPDGTVGGVVYAEALSDPSVGYALAPDAVAARVRPALGTTQSAPTGSCTR